jgi:cytosolic carboxypeptidase protein 6
VAVPLNSKKMKGKSQSGGSLVLGCNFECGNLGSYTMINDNEYEISIRPDTNNPKHRLWFYYSVSNAKANQRIIFHVTNFSKTKSLYREGMSPLVRSKKRQAWQRIPEKNVFYYRSPQHKKSYVLSFLFQFDDPHDTYYFAYSFPYTYTDLQRYLHELDSRSLHYYARELLCRTVQHRRLDILTITNAKSSKPKKTIFISARVHPGETPAQYICQGIIDFLVSDSADAKALRDNLVFKIIPMLNPDGVFLGNYRCSYTGYDLNRCWTDPSDWCHPELAGAKKIILQYHHDKSQNLDLFLDIHAHSTAANSFMYCNSTSDRALAERESLFPRMLDLNSTDFSFQQTKADSDPNKEGTGRRALGQMLSPGVRCYTLEVSFYASTNSACKLVPYTQQSYMELGRNVALTFIDLYKLPSSNARGVNRESRNRK